MKKFTFFRPLLALFAVFTLTMCEDQIESFLGGETETTLNFTGVTNITSLTSNGEVDLTDQDIIDSDVLVKAASVKSVNLTLNDDFSSESITMNVKLTVGTNGAVTVINKNVTLVKGVPLEIPLEPAIDIFSYLSNKKFNYNFVGTPQTSLTDTNAAFSIDMKLNVITLIEL